MRDARDQQLLIVAHQVEDGTGTHAGAELMRIGR